MGDDNSKGVSYETPIYPALTIAVLVTADFGCSQEIPRHTLEMSQNKYAMQAVKVLTHEQHVKAFPLFRKYLQEKEQKEASNEPEQKPAL